MNLFSLEFLILLFVLFIAYYIVPKRMQWICLLTASVVFYAFSGPRNLLLVGLTALSTWGGALWMNRLTRQFKAAKKEASLTKEQKRELKSDMVRRKRIVLIAVLVFNFGILSYFKYWHTIYAGVSNLLRREQTEMTLGLLLPLGISFYTFQSVGYLIDQYHGAYAPERNFLKYFLFVSFFPQMIQGPINRFADLGGQFFEPHELEWEQIKRALFLMLFGLMKKYAIANLLAAPIAAILDAPAPDIPGSVVVAGILMYSAQQYADFSGGIDLVLGIAQLFGIYMMPNFRQPYFAVSLGDFWRRWHISLGAFMRDYIFYPFALTKPMQKLGKWGIGHLGKDVGRVLPACVGNLLVFFIVGIWHGAELHFILWGLYNGLVIAAGELCAPLFLKWKTALHIREDSVGFHVFSVIRTFLIVNIGWYFDRIVKFSDCMLCMKNTVLHFGITEFGAYMRPLMEGVLSVKVAPVIVFAIFLVFLHSCMAEKQVDVFAYLGSRPRVLRWGVYYILLGLTQFAMSYATSSEAFLYAVF